MQTPSSDPAKTITMDDSHANLKALHTSLALHLFEHANEGLIVTDADTVIESVNPIFEKITGYSAKEALGKTPAMLHSGQHTPKFYQSMWKKLNKTGLWEGEIWNRRKNGELYLEWLKIVAIKNAGTEVTHYIGHFRKLSAHSDSYQMEHLAHHDILTTLPNRALFNEVLERELNNAKRRMSTIARLQTIHNTGIRLSIDDFGTGYSSMGYLKRCWLKKGKGRHSPVWPLLRPSPGFY